MYLNVPRVTISSLQRTTKPLTDNDVVCVFKSYEPAFYTVSPARFNELIGAEIKNNEYAEIIQALKDGRLIAEDL